MIQNRPFARTSSYTVRLQRTKEIQVDWHELHSLGVSLCNLHPSLADFVSCDRVVQRACLKKIQMTIICNDNNKDKDNDNDDLDNDNETLDNDNDNDNDFKMNKVVWIHFAFASWIHSYLGNVVTKLVINNSEVA